MAGDLCVYALLSLRKAPRTANFGVALALIVATRAHAAIVGLLVLVPLYGVWSVAAGVVRRRGPAFGILFAGLLGFALSTFLVLLEPSFALARTLPATWFFGLLGDLLPGLCELAGRDSTCREMAPIEALLVDAYVYLPSILVGLAPLLGLAVDHRFRGPGLARDDETWIGPRTSSIMLALWGASALVDATGFGQAWFERSSADSWALGLGARSTHTGSLPAALYRTYLAQGDVIAWSYFAALPLAVWRARFLFVALVGAAVLGAHLPRALVAVGLALALLGWARRKPHSSGAVERVPLAPLVMGSRYRSFALAVAVVLTLVSLTGYSAWEPGLGPVQSADLRELSGAPACRRDPAGMEVFRQFSIGCAEAGFEAGITGGLTPRRAERLCAASGLRVCTDREWTAACQGPAGHHYPSPASGRPETRPPQQCPPALGPELPEDYPIGCVNNAGLYGMVGGLVEWVRDGRGGYVLKGTAPKGAGGLASRCDLHARLLFPENYEDRLDYSFLGTRCCSDPPTSDVSDFRAR